MIETPSLKDVNRTKSNALGFRLDDALYRAFTNFKNSQEWPIGNQDILEVALKEYLTRKGFYPPPG